MAASLLRCSRLIEPLCLKPGIVNIRTTFIQQYSWLSKRDCYCNSTNNFFNKNALRERNGLLVATNKGQIRIQQSVSFSSFFRRKMFQPTIINMTFIGFAAMSFLMLIESFYYRYKRSGYTLSGLFVSLFHSESQKMSLSEIDINDTFSTKYASILSAEEIQKFNISRIVNKNS